MMEHALLEQLPEGRDIPERTARFVDDLDTARDRAAITQEQLRSNMSEQMKPCISSPLLPRYSCRLD